MKKVFFIPLVLCFISSAGGYGGFFEKGPFFWKAEKDGRVLHILGTVHVGVDFEDLKCSEEISQSLAQANLVWTESNQSMKKAYKTNLLARLRTEVFQDLSGDSFRSLNEESKNFFQKKVSETGVSLERLKTSSYLVFSSSVPLFCFKKHEKFIQEWLQLKSKKEVKVELSLDFQIQKLVENKGISQNYLDSQQDMDNLTEVEINLISRIGEDFSFKEEIEENIKNFDKNCTQENLEKDLEVKYQLVAKIIENTLSGQDFDAQDLLVQTFKELGLTENQIKKFNEVFSKDLLKRRNENWLKKIVSAHQEEESMFIAAGLAHFTEDYNVLDMLNGEGFTIKRYSAGCAAEESY